VRAIPANPRSRQIVYIAHELTAHNRACLLDGTIDAVIDQNPRVAAREAFNVLSQSAKGLSYDYHRPRLQVIFRENIPEA
jgi:LacI family transcriptional regulator